MVGKPSTLPVHCPHCGGPVTLQMAEWPDRKDQPLTAVEWTCPYCQKANAADLPGRLAWVTKRADSERTH